MAHAQPSRPACLVDLAARHPGALDDLYALYSVPAFSLALRMMGDRDRAQDVVKSGFATIRRCAGEFDPACDAELAWVLRQVRRACLDALRGTMLAGTVTPNPIAESDRVPVSAGGVALRSVPAQKVQAVLAGLPVAQRDAVELAYFGGMTCRQIAAQVDAPPTEVSQHLRLGLAALQRGLRVGSPEPSARSQ